MVQFTSPWISADVRTLRETIEVDDNPTQTITTTTTKKKGEPRKQP